MSLFPDFNPATETLTAGSLTLSFHDDGDPSSDKFNYVLDLLSGDGTVTSGSGPFVWTLGVLSELADGTVVVKLDTKTGDFYFDKAVLSASGERVIVVPTDDTPHRGAGAGLDGAARRGSAGCRSARAPPPRVNRRRTGMQRAATRRPVLCTALVVEEDVEGGAIESEGRTIFRQEVW